MFHAQLVYLGLAFVLNLCTKNVCSDIKKKPTLYIFNWYIKDVYLETPVICLMRFIYFLFHFKSNDLNIIACIYSLILVSVDNIGNFIIQKSSICHLQQIKILFQRRM